jgi:hypothetical protein
MICGHMATTLYLPAQGIDDIGRNWKRDGREYVECLACFLSSRHGTPSCIHIRQLSFKGPGQTSIETTKEFHPFFLQLHPKRFVRSVNATSHTRHLFDILLMVLLCRVKLTGILHGHKPTHSTSSPNGLFCP